MNDEHLSDHGIARRDQILRLAHAEAHRRRRRRSLRRVAVVTLLLTLVSLLALRFRPRETIPSPRVQSVAQSLPPASQPAIAIEYIQTDPTITDRLTLPPISPRWTSIDDHELLQELAAAGQPAGIVCMNGKTFLLTDR